MTRMEYSEAFAEAARTVGLHSITSDAHRIAAVLSDEALEHVVSGSLVNWDKHWHTACTNELLMRASDKIILGVEHD